MHFLLQVMALQAQLALKDAEVAAAAAQLDASGAGQAFTSIPVGLTRLNAPAAGSGDTGSQRGESFLFLFLTCTAVTLSGESCKGSPVHPALLHQLCIQHCCTRDVQVSRKYVAGAAANCPWLALAGCWWLLLSPTAREGAVQIESCCSRHT